MGLSAPILPTPHGGVAHAGTSEQGRFNFVQLNAEPADLHLVVESAQELEVAIRQLANTIARAVEQRTRCRAKGMGYENLDGQLGPIVITASETVSADVQLAGKPRRHRILKTVQHNTFGPANGTPDGQAVPRLVQAEFRRHHIVERRDDGLRRTVGIHQGDTLCRRMGLPLADSPGEHHIAPDDQQPELRAKIREVLCNALVRPLLPEGRGQVEHRDAGLAQNGGKVRRGIHALVGNVEHGPRKQG